MNTCVIEREGREGFPCPYGEICNIKDVISCTVRRDGEFLEWKRENFFNGYSFSDLEKLQQKKKI